MSDEYRPEEQELHDLLDSVQIEPSPRFRAELRKRLRQRLEGFSAEAYRAEGCQPRIVGRLRLIVKREPGFSRNGKGPDPDKDDHKTPPKPTLLLAFSVVMVTALAAALLALVLLVVPPGPEPATEVTSAPVYDPATEPAYEPVTGQVYEPVFEPAPCEFPSLIRYKVECGYLVVPEDRSQPEGAQARLYVAIFKTNNRHPEPDPVIHVPGAGYDYISNNVQIIRNTERFLVNRDYILYNQRGSNLNQPALTCPGYPGFAAALTKEGLSREKREARQIEFLLGCQDDLLAQGVNLEMYNSAANAADLNDLWTALGYDQVNLYGTSYGARLALTVMRDYPESVRSAILDSPVPLQVSYDVHVASNIARALRGVFDSCTADVKCNTAYPGIGETFYRVVEKLNAKPAPIKTSQGAMLVDGYLFAESLIIALYSPDDMSIIPWVIYSADKGNLQGTAEFVEANLTLGTSYGAYYSTICREEVAFESYDDALALAAGDPLVDIFTSPYNFKLCESWQSGIADPIENQPVYSSIPALVLTGQYAFAAPPDWARLVARAMSNSYYYEFDGLGQGVVRSNKCGLDIGLQFFDDPASEPDTSCMRGLKLPGFLIKTEKGK